MIAAPEPRLHRVRLCRDEYFEIEVMAVDRVEAFHVASAMQQWARRDFITVIYPFRAQVLRADHPRRSGHGLSLGGCAMNYLFYHAKTGPYQSAAAHRGHFYRRYRAPRLAEWLFLIDQFLCLCGWLLLLAVARYHQRRS